MLDLETLKAIQWVTLRCRVPACRARIGKLTVTLKRGNKNPEEWWLWIGDLTTARIKATREEAKIEALILAEAVMRESLRELRGKTA